MGEGNRKFPPSPSLRGCTPPPSVRFRRGRMADERRKGREEKRTSGTSYERFEQEVSRAAVEQRERERETISGRGRLGSRVAVHVVCSQHDEHKYKRGTYSWSVPSLPPAMGCSPIGTAMSVSCCALCSRSPQLEPFLPPSCHPRLSRPTPPASATASTIHNSRQNSPAFLMALPTLNEQLIPAFKVPV